MYITLEADYAVRIVNCLAKNGSRMDAKALSAATGVTLRFSLKILRKLVAQGIVRSYKGTQGGYELARRAAGDPARRSHRDGGGPDYDQPVRRRRRGVPVHPRRGGGMPLQPRLRRDREAGARPPLRHPFRRMTAPFAAGLAAGCVWAAADALLLRYAAKKAAKAPERAGTLVMLGFAARWFFTIALIALALFLPQLDAVGALLPLIAQKLLLALLAALPRGQKTDAPPSGGARKEDGPK